MKSPKRGSRKENQTKSPRLRKTNLAGSSSLFVDTEFTDFPSWGVGDGDHKHDDQHPNVNGGANNSEEVVELLDEEEEEVLRPQLTRERTRRFELQERSNLRHQLNRSVSSRGEGEAVAEPSIRRPRPPSRDDSWESGMLSNFMSMSDASPTANVAPATASIDRPSYWDVPVSSSTTSTRLLQRHEGVHRQHNSDAPSTSVDTPDTASTGESDEESSTSEECELVPESSGINKADPGEEDYHDEDNDSWGSYQEENIEAQQMVARSVKRCSTTDWHRLVGDTSDSKNHSLRLLEEKNWWGADAVVVAPAVGSPCSAAAGLQCIKEGDEEEGEEENSQQQSVDDDSADSSTVQSGSNRSTVAPLSEMSGAVQQKKAQQLSHRVPPARTRTGMLRDAFQRIMTATNLEWNEGKTMEPQEDVGGGSHERAHHIRSSRKTKKDESIAAASIVVPPSSKQREKRRSSCKGRGRRAVDAWRRELRNKNQKQKKIEQSRYAFNLEFDPFTLKPVEFDNNVFRCDDQPESPPPEKVTPVEIVEEQEVAPKEDKVKDDVSVVSNNAWHQEMEDLFATAPEKHRKKFVSRAEF